MTNFPTPQLPNSPNTTRARFRVVPESSGRMMVSAMCGLNSIHCTVFAYTIFVCAT